MSEKAVASVDQCPVMAKLNLTDEQKAKVQAICDGCEKGKCSKSACKKMTEELEKVLTPEQMTQFKAACADMKKEGKCCSKSGKSCCKKSEKAGCAE
jgi:Spy/CpxP family protein refolding chaperone